MHQFHIRFNAVVKRFILADLVWLAGWGLLSPIFAVFVLQQIPGATVVTIGTAAAVYWILKSVIQIPVALAIDRTASERDDYLVLVVSLMLAGLTSFSYVLVHTVAQLYLVEVLHAVSFALYIPSWNGIFTRHLDPEHRALEFALDSGAVGIATGIAGLLGSIIMQAFGFQVIFITTAVLSFAAAIIIFNSPSIVFPRHRTPTSPFGLSHAACGLCGTKRGASAREDLPAADHTPRNLGK